MAYLSHLERYYVRGVKNFGGGVIDTFDKKFFSRTEAAKMKQQLLGEGYIQVDIGVIK